MESPRLVVKTNIKIWGILGNSTMGMDRFFAESEQTLPNLLDKIVTQSGTVPQKSNIDTQQNGHILKGIHLFHTIIFWYLAVSFRGCNW